MTPRSLNCRASDFAASRSNPAELAEAYQAKYPQIVAFVQRGVSGLYGDIPAKVLEQSLGMPLIDLDWNAIMYLEHTLDKTHAIEVEFGGDFDQLYQVIIGK